MKCFYHKVDADGHLSGWIVKKYYPECEMIGVNYGEKLAFTPPKEQGETIFIVDFSFTLDEMEFLNENTNLIWIDHHQTAIDEMKDLKIKGFRNTEYAACVLTYIYCRETADNVESVFTRPHNLCHNVHGYNLSQVPLFIKYVGDYDAWRHEFKPDSTYFNRGLYKYPTDPTEATIWYNLETDEHLLGKIIEEGRLIYGYQMNSAESKCKSIGYSRSVAYQDLLHVIPSAIMGYDCFIINQAHWGSLQYGERMKEYDICMCYHWTGKHWVISMRSGTVDVGSIAKANGGGGHKLAAGFECKELPSWIL